METLNNPAGWSRTARRWKRAVELPNRRCGSSDQRRYGKEQLPLSRNSTTAHCCERSNVRSETPTDTRCMETALANDDTGFAKTGYYWITGKS